MTLAKGETLKNRYHILEILGEGGMGAVYTAHDDTLGVVVAVKENLFTGEEYVRQFRVEATILASLRHANLTRVTDHFEEGEVQYLVMDYIDGEDLRDRMDRLGILEEEEVIVIGAAICDALLYLHTRVPSVLHRDVKPGNVKIAPDGKIYLVDFGLAKIVKGSQITITGARAMTPGYSPPEQYGTARTDARTDIYSLGATLFSALTGALPEDGLSRAMKQAELTTVRRHNPKVSRKLAGVIEKSLAVQPEDRYQNAAEFKKALTNARGITRRRLANEELTIPPPPGVPAVQKMSSPEAEELGTALRERVEIGIPAEADTPVRITDEPGEQTAARLRRRRQTGCWTSLLVLLVLLVGGGAASYYFFPDMTAEAIAFFVSPPQTATSPAATATAELIVQPTVPTSTAVPVTPTPEIVLSATATTEPTATETSTPEPTATPTQTPIPTPLGGSNRIAFASDRSGTTQIWIQDIDSGEAFRVTEINGGACQPDWSPDGSQIVFTSPCTTEQEEYPESRLYMINEDGSGQMALPTQGGGDFDPAWSPDGGRISFTSLRGGSPEIFIIFLTDFSVQPVVEEGFRNLQPAWNALGDRLAFSGARPGPFRIWLTDMLGNLIEPFSVNSGLKHTSPAWSPDGQLIVYTQRELPDGVPNVVIAPLADGGEFEYFLIVDAQPRRQANFSPDGNWLVYESWPGGSDHDIYYAKLLGIDETQFTVSESFDFDPVWKPVP
jgi:serine/threonine protein kinase